MQQDAEQAQLRDDLERAGLEAEDDHQEQRQSGHGIKEGNVLQPADDALDPPIEAGNSLRDHGSPFANRRVLTSVARAMRLAGSKVALQYSMTSVQSGSSPIARSPTGKRE